jgi:hypothetical protein
MSFEHFERGYLLPAGCKDLIDVIELKSQPEAKVFLKPKKPLFMTVCSSCQAKVFVGVPTSGSSTPTESNTAVPPVKSKIPFVCPRCGHKQSAEH